MRLTSWLWRPALVLGCGGTLVSFPVVDDAGDVVEADGASYSSNVCIGWDASGWWVPAPTCSGASVGNPVCEQWAQQSFPKFGSGGCEFRTQPFDEGGTCERAFNVPMPSTCDPSNGGDALCRALYQPFVRTQQVAYACQYHSVGGPPTEWYACGAALSCNCPIDEICVYSDAGSGGVACVPPCLE